MLWALLMPTLLLIDDEPSILHAFRRAFRDPDVVLLTAGTALEGVEMATQRQPDIVILDLNLPDQSGLEAFRRIHALDAGRPVIFITGLGPPDTAIEAIKLGAFEYLLKPLDPEQIRAVVKRAFEISRLSRVPAVVAEEEPVPERSDVLVGRTPA